MLDLQKTSVDDGQSSLSVQNEGAVYEVPEHSMLLVDERSEDFSDPGMTIESSNRRRRQRSSLSEYEEAGHRAKSRRSETVNNLLNESETLSNNASSNGMNLSAVATDGQQNISLYAENNEDGTAADTRQVIQQAIPTLGDVDFNVQEEESNKQPIALSDGTFDVENGNDSAAHIDDSEDSDANSDAIKVITEEEQIKAQQVIEIEDEESSKEISETPVEFKKASDYVCPICMEPPVAALMTNCGHVFCTPCLYGMVNSSKGHGRRNGLCALCRKNVKLQDVRMIIMKKKRVRKPV